MPLLGKIHLGGMTFDEAEAVIQKAYSDANLIQNAQVSVRRLEPAEKASIKFGPIQIGDRVRIQYSSAL